MTEVTDNVMRHNYKELNDEEKGQIKNIKDAGLALHEAISKISASGSRELALAKTKTEEAVMWATKHVTK